ncbi:MAG: class I SAM-dependent methyltransferase [Ignavibacteriae bacterium]|jgi:23S rRNA (cytosine1962-C5)-methyltransferase|nr:class I SAM-dependent methyltransferase [Ignavibacteriota bacterium]
MKKVILKPGREKSLLRKHPWVFSGAIDKVTENPQNGENIEVFSSKNIWLARGSFSEKSQIRVRIWTFNESDNIDQNFFHSKIKSALNLRKSQINENTNSYRIINSESDGIPGFILDKYSDFLVCQFLSAGSEFWKGEIIESIKKGINPLGIYERSDSDVRLKEGLEIRNGNLFGEEPPDLIEILENGLKIFVDVKKGHKTGFYLDQRENRNLLLDYAGDKNILNCFSFSGGFSLYALKSGAKSVVNIDSSSEALSLISRNIEANCFTAEKNKNINGDVFKVLRKFRDENNLFNLIILDPPKFIESKANIEKASRGYKDINMLAFKILDKGGILFTFSCSGLMDRELFQKIVSDAALDAGRNIKIIKWLTQSADHPVAANFPEGLYLKGLICYAE